MNINLKDCVKLHNRYELELKDAATGAVKQRAHAENVVLDRIWSLWTSYINVRMFGAVAMGTGSGTPASTDTDMFTRAFIGPRSGTSGDYMTFVSKNEAYPTCTYTFKCDIPATSSYTGNLTEVGLIATNNNSGNIAIGGLWSHAMLQDAEGQAITINKTDLDVLTVTATVYVTFSSTDSNFMWIKPGPNNAICKVFAATDMNAIAPFAASRYKMHHCTSVLTDDDDCITQFASASSARVGSPTFNLSTMTLNVPTARLDRNVGNGTYYKGLILSDDSSTVAGLGGIVYPNATIFPNQEIAGMRVGTGDGVTTDYALPINLIVQGTDKVYVNDVLQQRGVDYTIDNANTTMADGTALSLMLIEEETASAGDVPAVPDYISLGIYSGYYSGISTTEIHLAADTQKPFSVENCRQGVLNTAKPIVYKLLDSACGKLNSFNIESVFATHTNESYYESSRYTEAGVSYSSPFAVYDSTADMTIPDLGSFASFDAAALGLLDEVFDEGTEYAEINDNFKFVKRERGVGNSNVIYRMCKYNPGNAYLANVSVEGNLYPWVVSVADPGHAEGPEALSYEFYKYASSYCKYGSVSYTPPRIEDLSFLDVYEEMWTSATTINGKFIKSEYSSEVYVDSSNANAKSYSIPITPGHAYFVEAISPGNKAKMVATDLNLSSATGFVACHATVVHNAVQVADDRVYFTAPSYATYLTIYASDSGQVAEYSIKDVTNLDIKRKLRLAPTAATTYYKAYRVIDDECPIGWTHEVIPTDAIATGIYNGLKVKVSGSSDGSSWVPIKTITLGNANASTFARTIGNYYYYQAMRVHTGLSCSCSTCTYSYYRVELDASEAVHPQISDVDALLVAPVFPTEAFSFVNYDNEVYESGTYDVVTPGLQLLYEGNGISFTNPPASGAIITMDGKIDRPYKNSNFVIDAAMTIHFGDA